MIRHTSINWRRYRTRLLSSLSIAAVFAGLIWLLGSEPAAQALAQLVTRVSSGHIQISGVSGSLFNAFSIQRLTWISTGKNITLNQLKFAWQPSQLWQHSQLHITQLSIQTLDIQLLQSDNQPTKPPATLRLPFDLVLPAARIQTLHLQRGNQQILIQPLTLSLHYINHHYQLQSKAQSTWGNGQLHLDLADQQPYAVNGQIGLSLRDGVHDYAVDTRLQGSLTQLVLHSTGKAGEAQGTLQAQLSPFVAQPLTQAALTVSHFNPADIADGLPTARIDGSARVVPVSLTAYRGEIHLTNQQPGTLDQQRLPVARMDTTFNGNATALTLADLSVELNGKGTISGSGQWHDNGLDLHLQARQIDLHALMQSLRPTQLHGALAMHMNAQQQQFSAQLAQADYLMDIVGTYQKQHLTLTSAKLRNGKSSLDFKGEMAFNGTRNFSAQGHLVEFNPAQFGRYPVAHINASFTTAGQIQPQLQTRLQLDIHNSRFNNAPLQGQASLYIAKQRLWNSHVQFQLGPNQLALQGSFGMPQDRLTWQLNAPDISTLGPAFSGMLKANGVLHGSFNQPAGEMTAQGSQLNWQSHAHIAQLNAHLAIGAGSNGRINLSADLRDFQAGKMRLDSGNLYVNGTRHKHTATLVAKNPSLNFTATLQGSLNQQSWSGQIMQLNNGEPYPLSLRAPANLIVSKDHVRLDHAELSIAHGSLKLDQLEYDAITGIRSQGSLSGIDAGYIQQRLRPNPNISNTITIGGKWQFNSAKNINGNFMLWREQGDISLIGDKTTALGINRAQLSVQADHNQLSTQIDVTGTTLGLVSAQASTTLARQGKQWVLSSMAPLQAHARIQIPSLAWLTATFSDTFNLDGALQGQMDLHGSLHAPVFSGTINGNRLAVGYPAQGVYLQNGILNAQFDQDSLRISQLDFHAGGTLHTQGIIKLNNGKPDMQLNVTATRLNIVNRPDRQVTLSGQAVITAANQHITTQADIAIDHANISLQSDNALHRSDDIIVVGRNAAPTRIHHSIKPAWGIDTRINIHLGKHVSIKGQGLEARIEGALKLNQSGNNLPLANGTLTIAEGHYSAFGQRLAITRGILNFAGVINNPGLDILATRTNPTVTVGVQVSGSVLSPTVKLVSTPEMTDSEKLSWLVLGHGTQNVTSGAETKAIQAAASYLLGKSNSFSLQSKLTQLTGLNEISLKGGGTIGSSVLSLGKRLSDRVYVNYEQGITGAKQLVRITYDLSRHLSLRAQGGTESTVDVFYTFRFD